MVFDYIVFPEPGVPVMFVEPSDEVVNSVRLYPDSSISVVDPDVLVS